MKPKTTNIVDDESEDAEPREPVFDETDEREPKKVNRKKKPKQEGLEALGKEVEDVETVLETGAKNPDIFNQDKPQGLFDEVEEITEEEGDTIDLDEADKDLKGKAEKRKNKQPKADLTPRADDVLGFF